MRIEALEPFFDEGLIESVIRQVKSGKEATVYMCRARPWTGGEFFAAKVYRPREERSFRNDAMYREGRMAVLKERDRRAVAKKTGWGREVLFGQWLFQEYENLNVLHAAGARVPRPVARGESAVLLEWIGDESGAAPHLREVRPSHDDAAALLDVLVGQVELFLRENLVHGDLSEYNVLFWQGGLTVIDLPQMVDPRFNHSAQRLLTRDLENVCRYFARFGVQREGRWVAQGLWDRWLRSEL